MAKIVLPAITAGYQSATQLTAAMDLLEAELQNKVLYRDNTSAESNVMEQDFDMNSNAILNASAISTTALTVGGVDMSVFATAAETSATNAGISAAAAAASVVTAEGYLDAFDDLYLGSKGAEPTLDNDGNALADGALYYLTTTNVMHVYDLGTTSWLQLQLTSVNQTNVDAAVANETNINTVATNVVDVNSFALTYLGAYSTGSEPTATVVGALYYNTTDSQLKLWDGATWEGAAFEISGAVTSFNTRAGAVSLLSADVTDALTYTPVAETAATGSATLPAGTTAQRDGSPASGYIRFNSTIGTFEGYGAASWGSIGGGATGGAGDAVFQENEVIVTTDYTLTTGRNALSVGPITVNSGVSVTIPSGQTWMVL
jgi:hypothetical protein